MIVQRTRSQAGVTLVEMLIVVGIVGLISLISVPAFMTYRQSMRIKSSLRQMTTELRGARQRAVSRARPVKVSYVEGLTSHSYQIFDGTLASPPAWTQLGIDRDLDPFVYIDASSSFTDDPIAAFADADTVMDIIFLPDGTTVMPAGLNDANVVLRITADIPFNQYTINVNRAGRLATTRARFN